MISRHTTRREDGYFTVTDLAEACGVAPWQVLRLIESDKIPAPSKSYKLSTRKYYLKEELDRLVKKINSGN